VRVLHSAQNVRAILERENYQAMTHRRFRRRQPIEEGPVEPQGLFVVTGQVVIS